MTTTSPATSTPSPTTSATTTPDKASIGQSILSSLDPSGSGIDTDTLITNLTAAQKASIEDPITTKQTANTAQISSAGSLASDLATFAQSLNTLVQGGTLQTQPVSSDTNVMSVSAVSGVPISALNQSITVNAIAQAQTLKSISYANGQAFDTGTLTLTVGGSGTPVPITIDSSNNTLAGIAQTINGKNLGVTANVITGSDGTATLVLKGATGAAQSFTLAGTDDGSATQPDGAASLASLSYAPGATGNGMTQTLAAQDASVTVDGVTVTRPTNSFSDVIPGVKMTLVKIGTINLSSTRPDDAITEAVNDFVSAYNGLLSELNAATATASAGGTAGPLQGNSAIRSLKSQLAKLTTTPLNASGTIRTLAELGVQTGQDGTLSVNATTLTNMLANHPDDVEAMFVTSQSSSSSKVLITSPAGSSASGVYQVTGITPATGGGNATGSINGVPMSASSWNLTAGAGNGADGLKLQILSGTPGTATIIINQGLGGALQAISDTLLGKSASPPRRSRSPPR
jgi:flagellar hook-associated protein 2